MGRALNGPNFAVYYAEDAYSTAGKIMGRQSAGKALMAGVVRRWPEGEIHGYGPARSAGRTMLDQMKASGFSGVLRWRPQEGDAALRQLGAVYYPAPVTADLAWMRNRAGPTSYSLFGVTHTLSSLGAMEQVASLIMPPHQPWDGLICTSETARGVVDRLQDELRAWYSDHLGATRFNTPALPVIPLGVNTPEFAREPDQIAQARAALGLKTDDVAFLFAGRLTFHAKGNPAPLYLALENAARRLGRTLVLIEAGVAPNASVLRSLDDAHRVLAPSIRFISVDGNDPDAYVQAWRAADVFTSLSDNIQETFGLTPVEAMAAGLPALVSDWNGYKDTVRDGIDGFRVPVILPDGGLAAGVDLARRHHEGRDTYDMYIGQASMATAVDLVALTEKCVLLASDPDLRRRMGEAGRQRAATVYDWPIILDRYTDFVASLGELRAAAGRLKPREPIDRALRPDPFALFADYPTQRLMKTTRVRAAALAEHALDDLLGLAVLNYVVGPQTLPAEVIRRLHARLALEEQTVEAAIRAEQAPAAQTVRAILWLVKLGLATCHE